MQNRCGPRALKRDRAAICQRLLIIFALAHYNHFFKSNSLYHSSNDNNRLSVTLNATHPPPASSLPLLPLHPPHCPRPQSQVVFGTPVPPHSHARGQRNVRAGGAIATSERGVPDCNVINAPNPTADSLRSAGIRCHI